MKSRLQLSFPTERNISPDMPHQTEGIEWLRNKKSAILADDMGLGKTRQLLKASQGKNTIVLCPPSVMNVWEQEAINLDIPVPNIISYTKVPKPFVITKTKGWDAKKKVRFVQPAKDIPEKSVLILDEAHNCKNWKSQRSEGALSMAIAVLGGEGQVWLATGTPMLNHPLELWQLLSIANIHWKVFGSWHRFISLFGGKKKHFGGYEFIPEAMEEIEIRKCLAPYLLRRMKSEVLKDLPKKSHQIHNVVVPRDLHKTTFPEASKATTPEEIQGIAGISEFRALLAMEKLRASIDLIESFENAGEPLVVYSKHVAPIEFLNKRRGWDGITGDTTNSKRAKAVADFQSGFLKGFASTIKAGGTGITLTRASHILFIDKEWSPKENEQAEDRLNRIGQVNPVVVHHIESDHPLDYHVNRVIGRKSEMIEGVFG